MSGTATGGWSAAAWRGARVGLALGGGAALAWALLGARRDGYLGAGLLDLACHSASRRLAGARLHLSAATLALLGALLCGAAAKLRSRPLRHLLLALPLGAATAVAITGAWIARDEVTPDLPFAKALVLHGALAAAGAVAAFLASLLLARGGIARCVAAALPWLAGGAFALDDQPLGEAGAARGGDGKQSLVLVSLDTLRADRLGCYGGERDTTPHLDAFAATAIRFADVSAPFAFTLTSHATMMTGLDPAAHGATLLGEKIEQRLRPYRDVPTLAAALRDAGWATIGLVDTCLWMQPGWGLERGFMIWRNVPGGAARKREALATLLRDLRGRPAFLFFHCFDAHSDGKRLPYERDARDAGRYAGAPPAGFDGCDPAEATRCASALLRHWNDTAAPLPDALVRHLSDLYDEGIRSLDREMGDVVELLRTAGLLDRGVVAITSDHGEEFREHGRFMHDAQLFEESLRVPLLLRLPGGSSGGRVVGAPAGLVDLAPTLADALGTTLPPMQGRSLLAALATPDDELRPVFSGALPDEEAVKLGRFKLLRRGEQRQLFDLVADPRETKDVAAGHPDVVEALARHLDGRRAENAALAATRSRAGAPAPSAAEIRKMDAIGY